MKTPRSSQKVLHIARIPEKCLTRPRKASQTYSDQIKNYLSGQTVKKTAKHFTLKTSNHQFSHIFEKNLQRLQILLKLKIDENASKLTKSAPYCQITRKMLN